MAEAELELPVLTRADSAGPIDESPGAKIGSWPFDCNIQWQGRHVRRT